VREAGLLGVTYKTAHRMGHKIRELMAGKGNPLAGIVEADETYIGGKRKGFGRGPAGKIPIVGVVERRGEVRATVVTNAIGHKSGGELEDCYCNHKPRI